LALSKLTKDIGGMTAKMAGVGSNMLMDHHILAIGKMITKLDVVFMWTLMDKCSERRGSSVLI